MTALPSKQQPSQHQANLFHPNFICWSDCFSLTRSVSIIVQYKLQYFYPLRRCLCYSHIIFSWSTYFSLIVGISDSEDKSGRDMSKAFILLYILKRSKPFAVVLKVLWRHKYSIKPYWIRNDIYFLNMEWVIFALLKISICLTSLPLEMSKIYSIISFLFL